MTSVIALQDEGFKAQLSSLVKRYAKNRHNYIKKDSDYNETEIRTDYIDELFKALDWDVNNLKGLAPFAQEVRRERGPTRGEPDYTFRLSTGQTSATPVFFVEAKAPKESLDNKHHIFQAKSYAFSAAQSSLVLVVLTNFERFRLYSVDSEPTKEDESDSGLVFDWGYDELEEKVSQLLLFRKSNVLNGSLNKLARHGVPIKMRPPVENPFLMRLDSLREKLAKGFFNANKGLSERDLNLLTDMILNRIVFIRFAEDRSILPPEDLRQVVNQWSYRKSETLLSSIRVYFEELNRRFNGRMFLDEANLHDYKIDDNILLEVVENFYSPNCPYRFDQIRVELLGEIYERYLGKVIVRKGRGVSIEEKPEVRHAKGVYYTPGYIVDEILKSCLLPKLQAIQDIEEIFELRGIDPACGSGTFLLGAYRLISNFILSRALESDETKERYLQLVDDDWKIKYPVKRNILEYCLNGVDIDPRAIRVSELSLYLKLLEDEPDIAVNPIPYLPSLYKNLQYGNSLIDSRMLPQLELDMEDSILNRISPFTWEMDETFGPIMRQGGFDWVMGNPPYIRMQVLHKFSGKETEIVQAHYDELKDGNPDIFVAFIVRGLDKIKPGGSLGFIISSKFMVTEYGEKIRKKLANEYDVTYLADFGDKQVFNGASTYTCILVVNKTEPKGATAVKLINCDPEPGVFDIGRKDVLDKTFDLRTFGANRWDLNTIEKEQKQEGFVHLEKICDIFQGIRTSDNGVFVITKAKLKDGLVIGYSPALKKQVELEAEICRPFLKGRQIGRNFHSKVNQYLVFPYDSKDPYTLIPFPLLKSNFPKTAEYLKLCEKRLKKRQDGEFNQKLWYGFLRSQSHDLIAEPKVMIQAIASKANFTFDPKGSIFYVTGYGLHIKKKANRSASAYRFYQAILKTERIDSKIKATSSKLRGGAYEYRKQYLKELWVPEFESANQSHSTISSIQEQIEEIGKRLLDAKEASLKREFSSQIDSLESDIELLTSVIYSGAAASSSDINKVQKIITRIEEHLELARKNANKKTSKKKAVNY